VIVGKIRKRLGRAHAKAGIKPGGFLIKAVKHPPYKGCSHSPTLYPHLGEQIPWAKRWRTGYFCQFREMERCDGVMATTLALFRINVARKHH